MLISIAEIEPELKYEILAMAIHNLDEAVVIIAEMLPITTKNSRRIQIKNPNPDVGV